jgi:hypothetical protein
VIQKASTTPELAVDTRRRRNAGLKALAVEVVEDGTVLMLEKTGGSRAILDRVWSICGRK